MLDSITIEKEKLLQIVLKNREKHANIFKTSYDNWLSAYMEMLNKLKEMALRGKAVPFHLIDLQPPVSYVECYDSVIEMLNLTNQKEITLDSDEFSKLVQDKWDWTRTFSSSSQSYSSSSSSSSHVATILEKIEQNYK